MNMAVLGRGIDESVEEWVLLRTANGAVADTYGVYTHTKVVNRLSVLLTQSDYMFNKTLRRPNNRICVNPKCTYSRLFCMASSHPSPTFSSSKVNSGHIQLM
jgi:hypothetical protein